MAAPVPEGSAVADGSGATGALGPVADGADDTESVSGGLGLGLGGREVADADASGGPVGAAEGVRVGVGDVGGGFAVLLTLGTPTRSYQFVVVGLISGMVALMLFATYQLEFPFSRCGAVDASAFTAPVERFDDIDRAEHDRTGGWRYR